MSTTQKRTAPDTGGTEDELVESCRQTTTNAVGKQGRRFMIQTEEDRLLGIAKAEHKKATECAAKAVEHARRAGDALNAIKAAFPHGGFGRFLDREFRKSARTARSYMLIARNWQSIADLRPASIAAALMGVKELRPPRKSSAPRIIEAELITDKPRAENAGAEAEVPISSDPFNLVLEALPKMTQEERQELFVMLAARWNCEPKGAA